MLRQSFFFLFVVAVKMAIWVEMMALDVFQKCFLGKSTIFPVPATVNKRNRQKQKDFFGTLTTTRWISEWNFTIYIRDLIVWLSLCLKILFKVENIRFIQLNYFFVNLIAHEYSTHTNNNNYNNIQLFDLPTRLFVIFVQQNSIFN